jgi:nucleoside-diphosphate-sugar epimerase
MSKILVTGGLGFIGHRVVLNLEDTHDISIADNLSGGHKNLYKQRKKLLKYSYFHDVDIDYYEPIDWAINHCKPDTIIHLASYPRQATVTKDPKGATRTMIDGLVNTLEAAKLYKVKRFVFISSSMVYGDFTFPVSEYNHCNPKGLYGILKLAGENIVKDYANDFEYVIVRPSAVYGPGDDNSRVIAKFLYNAINNKEITVSGADEILDFTYIDDVANGIALASTKHCAAYNTYNITRGVGRTLLEAAQIAHNCAGAGIITINERNDSFPSRNALNIEKARNELGFNPTVDIEEGIKRYYACFNNSIHRT